jgi:hypothetical protein
MYLLKRGTTAFIMNVEMRTLGGVPMTGLTYANVTAYWIAEGQAGTATVISLSAGTAGTWSSGGWVAVDPTNMPGAYQLGMPNAVVASAVRSVKLRLASSGAYPRTIEIQLPVVDPYDAVRAGMTALPNATAGASGGVPLYSPSFAIAATVAAPVTLHADYDAAKAAASAGSITTLSGKVDVIDAVVDAIRATDVVALDALIDTVKTSVDLAAQASDLSDLSDRLDAMGLVVDTVHETDCPGILAAVEAEEELDGWTVS